MSKPNTPERLAEIRWLDVEEVARRLFVAWLADGQCSADGTLGLARAAFDAGRIYAAEAERQRAKGGGA
jgi:hypothetical protein